MATLEADKELRRDGYQFFQKIWHIVGLVISSCAINSTIYCEAKSITDFRPISGLNTVYKLIAKILTYLRTKPCLQRDVLYQIILLLLGVISRMWRLLIGT